MSLVEMINKHNHIIIKGESKVMKNHIINKIINDKIKEGYRFGYNAFGRGIVIVDTLNKTRSNLFVIAHNGDGHTLDLNNVGDFNKALKFLGINKTVKNVDDVDGTYLSVLGINSDKTIGYKDILISIINGDIDIFDKVNIRRIEDAIAKSLKGAIFEDNKVMRDIINSNKALILKTASFLVKYNDVEEIKLAFKLNGVDK